MSEKRGTPRILSEDTLIGLMDLVGQLQRNVIVLRRILVRKNVVTEEELQLLTEHAEQEIKPLRDQFLEAIERAKQRQALEDLELNEKTKVQ